MARKMATRVETRVVMRMETKEATKRERKYSESARSWVLQGQRQGHESPREPRWLEKHDSPVEKQFDVSRLSENPGCQESRTWRDGSCRRLLQRGNKNLKSLYLSRCAFIQ